MPWSPLGQGFLTGKVDPNSPFESTDIRSRFPRFTSEAMKANQALIDLLGKVAARKQATPAQIALAWLLAQKPWIIPIPGTRKLERLDENLRSTDIELTPEDLAEINQTAASVQVQSGKYERIGHPQASFTSSGICFGGRVCRAQITGLTV